MTALPVVLAGVGTAVSVFGAISGAQANSQAFDRASAINLRNERIARKNASTVIHTGAQQLFEQDMKTGELLATQLATQSSSGLSLNSRSMVLTRRAARELGRQDSQRVIEAVRIRAAAYRDQATAFASDATINARASANAMLAGYVNAGSAIISGATTISGTPYFKNTIAPQFSGT